MALCAALLKLYVSDFAPPSAGVHALMGQFGIAAAR